MFCADMRLVQQSRASVTIVSNRSSMTEFMLQLERDVRKLCDCGAYIGWYVRLSQLQACLSLLRIRRI